MVVAQCVQDVLSRFESQGDFDEWELSRHIDKAIGGASVTGAELQAALAEHDAFSFRRRRVTCRGLWPRTSSGAPTITPSGTST